MMRLLLWMTLATLAHAPGSVSGNVTTNDDG